MSVANCTLRPGAAAPFLLTSMCVLEAVHSCTLMKCTADRPPHKPHRAAVTTRQRRDQAALPVSQPFSKEMAHSRFSQPKACYRPARIYSRLVDCQPTTTSLVSSSRARQARHAASAVPTRSNLSAHGCISGFSVPLE